MDATPNTTYGRNIGYLLASLTAGLALTLLWLATQLPSGWVQTAVQLIAISLTPFIPYILFQSWRLGQLTYEINNNQLIVHHGARHTTYPLTLAKPVPVSDYSHVTRFAGLRWPGCFVGRGQAITSHGEAVTAVFYATRPLKQQLLIQTAETIIGLSPQNPQAIIAALSTTQPAQPTLISSSKPTLPAPQSLLRSSISHPPPIHAALNFILWVLAITALLILPTNHPFPAPLGTDGAIGATAVWLILPAVGLIILTLNHLLATRLHPDFPHLSRLLNITTTGVQLLLALTLVNLFF